MNSIQKWETQVNTIIQQYQHLTRLRSNVSKILKSALKDLDLSVLPNELTKDLFENKLVDTVSTISLDGLKIGAIDGGVLFHSLSEMDLIITRSVGVLFSYGRNEQISAEYLPDDSPAPKIIAKYSVNSNRESEIFANLERGISELQVAINLLEEKFPNIILIDGSIVPQPTDKPPHNSTTLPKYEELIQKFEELYHLCLKKSVILAGVVKDSRQSRFMDMLGRFLPLLIPRISKLEALLQEDYRYVISSTRDTDFLPELISPGTRTCVFRFTDAPMNHPTLLDFQGKNWGRVIYAFYLRTVKYDRPIRIEFLTTDINVLKTAQKLAGVLLPMSSYHEEFGFPTILVEADAHAKLVNSDMQFLIDEIGYRLGIPTSFTQLRRQQKPF